MRPLTVFAVALVAAAVLAGSALAKPRPPALLPFPSAKAGPVFIASHVTTTDGVLASWFKPGDQVVFRAYAVDRKTGKYVASKDVKFFYVTIPGQPNVKLAYNAKPGAMSSMPCNGTWTVPSTFSGQVNFRMLIKLKA